MRLRLHNVRVDPELLGVLRGTRSEQRGRGVSQASERDHRRFRRAARRGAVQIYREDQEHRRHVHGCIR